MHGPKCQSDACVKNGIIHNKQRYRCTVCGCNDTQSHANGYSKKDTILATILHLSGMSLNSMGEVIGVCAQSVMRWIKEMADQTPAPEMPTAPARVEIDEMHHFIQKN